MGSLIRANTVIAKFRPLRTSHLLPDRAGARHKYSRGCRFWCCIGGGGGIGGAGVKINCSGSKGCHFCQVFWEFTDEMLTNPSTPALLFSVLLRNK